MSTATQTFGELPEKVINAVVADASQMGCQLLASALQVCRLRASTTSPRLSSSNSMTTRARGTSRIRCSAANPARGPS